MRDVSHRKSIVELFKEDKQFAVEVLNSILEDGDQAELLGALRPMAIAFGGTQNIADKAGVNSTHIYKILSPTGNPDLKSFMAILNAMDLRLMIQLKESK